MSRSFLQKFLDALTFNRTTVSSVSSSKVAELRSLIEATKIATEGPWFAVPDDLVGGWCVRTVDAPPSSGRGITIADFVREEDARLIAAIRNLHLRTEAHPDIRAAETSGIAIAEDGRLYLKPHQQ